MLGWMLILLLVATPFVFFVFIICFVLYAALGWMSILLVGGIVVLLLYRTRRLKKRIQFIETYNFPVGIIEKVKCRYPHLSDEELSKVIKGLRKYFLLQREGGFISMPSQVVDVAWHEFILFTKLYKEFCKHGVGKFIHHTPAEAMSTSDSAKAGIKRAWYLSCLRENIDPKNPARLPLLFSLDAELYISDGFRYSLDCTGRDNEHCAGGIGCGGGAGGGCGGTGGCGGAGGCGGG